MIKSIKLKGRDLIYNTSTREGFDDILSVFDKKIRTTVSSWVQNIPDHDIDDLCQVCRMKLIDALDSYDETSNWHFSTYVYTVWHRKLSQLSYKYKTKKNSPYIKNDNYVSFNYAFDRVTDSFFLMLEKHKCPLNKCVIDSKTCSKCEFHNGYANKILDKGNLKGESRKFTKCGYFKNVLDRRGINFVSINQPIRTTTNSDKRDVFLSNILFKNNNEFASVEFNMDIARISEMVDSQTFSVLNLLIDGFNKSEIIKRLSINSNMLNKHIAKLKRNKILKNLLLKNEGDSPHEVI